MNKPIYQNSQTNRKQILKEGYNSPKQKRNQQKATHHDLSQSQKCYKQLLTRTVQSQALKIVRRERIYKIYEIIMLKLSINVLATFPNSEQQSLIIQQIKKLLEKLVDSEKKNNSNKQNHLNKQIKKPTPINDKKQIYHKEQLEPKEQIDHKKQIQHQIQNDPKKQSSFRMYKENTQEKQYYQDEYQVSSMQNDLIGNSEIYISDFKKFRIQPQLNIKDNKIIFQKNEYLYAFGVGLIHFFLKKNKYQNIRQIKNFLMNYNFNNLMNQNAFINSITDDEKQLKAILLKILNLFIQKKDISQIMSQYDIKQFIVLIFQTYASQIKGNQMTLPQYYQQLGSFFNLQYSEKQSKHIFVIDSNSKMIIEQNTTNELQVYIS